jgi:hypothetical protein
LQEQYLSGKILVSEDDYSIPQDHNCFTSEIPTVERGISTLGSELIYIHGKLPFWIDEGDIGW